MEILAPAGDWDKLQFAIAYGADAVYTAGQEFGLRAKAGNLSSEELEKAVQYAHAHKRKVYVTVNIFAHNRDLDTLPGYIKFLHEIGVDAVIVSDPGVLSVVKEVAPGLPIHLSTQANTTSWKSAEFWAKNGVKRIILARELTFTEITQIVKTLPQLELEIFVHGAMCISYSGRCFLSAFLNNRSANRGLCTQPCRWKYELLEESRPGQYFQIEEDERGTYVMNSKDLCLFDHLEEILHSGVTSIKIEGRMKSLYYVANTTRVYKKALEYLKKGKTPPQSLKEELDKISHRYYTTGFFSGFDSSDTQYHETSSYIRDYQYLGEVIEYKSPEEDNQTQPYVNYVNVKAKFSLGDNLEIITPGFENDLHIRVDEIYSLEHEPLIETKPNQVIKLITGDKLAKYAILRKKIG